MLYIKNRNQLLEWTKSYKKVCYETCAKEKFEMKTYFCEMNIPDSRLYFRVLNFVTPTIRLNFKSDRKFRAEKYICTDCIIEDNGIDANSQPTNPEEIEVTISDRRFRGFPDSQKHQMEVCSANADLRSGKNIRESEKDCVTFFHQLLQRRMNKLK